MIFTDGLAHGEFHSFTVLIRCSQLERSVWCKCFSAIGAYLLETSPRPSDSLNTSQGSLGLMTEACQDEGRLKTTMVAPPAGLEHVWQIHMPGKSYT